MRQLLSALAQQQSAMKAVVRARSPQRNNQSPSRGGARDLNTSGTTDVNASNSAIDDTLRAISEGLKIIMEVIERINVPVPRDQVTLTVTFF